MEIINAFKYILKTSRKESLLPIDIITFSRVEEIGNWFKNQDISLQRTLVAVINSEYERWKNSAPILAIIGTILTAFFLLSFLCLLELCILLVVVLQLVFLKKLNKNLKEILIVS